MKNIKILPDEILEAIFLNLPFEDLKSARRVCKRWLWVSSGANITQHELVTLDSKELALFKTPRGCLNLKIESYVSRHDRKEGRDGSRPGFWIQHGSSIKSIAVHNYNGHCRIWELIKKHCPKIAQVELHCYDNHRQNSCYFAQNLFFKNVFEQVGQHLIFLSFHEMSIDSIDMLTSHADYLPNLQHLMFTEIYLDDKCSLSGLANFTSLRFLSFRGTSLSDKQLKNLKKISKQLTGLDIGATVSFTDIMIKVFGFEMRLNLIALKMGWMEMDTRSSDKALARILPNLPNLKLLDLSQTESLTSLGVQAIIDNCQQLTHLSLDQCDPLKLGLLGSANINMLVNLVYLNLNYCHVPHKILLKLRFKELATLGLSGKILTKKAIKKLLENCPKLRCVYVGVNDDANERLARFIPKKLKPIFIFESLPETSIFIFGD